MIQVEIIADAQKIQRMQRAVLFLEAAGVFDLSNGVAALHFNSQGELMKVDKSQSYLRDKTIFA